MSATSRRRASQAVALQIKEEPKPHNSEMNNMGNSQHAMESNKVNYSDNVVHNTRFEAKNQKARATSPLDTIAEVACRIGTALPLKGHSVSNEESLPANAFGEVSGPGSQERGSDSPTSIPAQQTTIPFPPTLTDQQRGADHEALASLHSLLGKIRSDNWEGLSNVLCLGNKFDKTSGVNGTKARKIAGQASEDMCAFKDVVLTKLENAVQEINRLKAEVLSLQNTIECMREGRNPAELQDVENGGFLPREHVLTVRPEDIGNVCFVVKRTQTCSEDKNMAKDEEIRIDGNELTIRVERRYLGKRENRSNDWMSFGSEAEAHDGKKMNQMEIRRELRQRMVRGESMTGMDSVCNSENSDWDYTESGNKRQKLHGASGKGTKGKTVRRRRDNWTEEENKVFLGMVLGNQEMEEMTLRRMLARRFSPRRTHEQCANHLRILRAQKKLPPAREESVAKKET